MAERLNMDALAVLAVIRDEAEATGRCDLPVARIAERANIGRTKARAAIRLAESLGAIAIEEAPGRKRVFVNRCVTSAVDSASSRQIAPNTCGTREQMRGELGLYPAAAKGGQTHLTVDSTVQSTAGSLLKSSIGGFHTYCSSRSLTSHQRTSTKAKDGMPKSARSLGSRSVRRQIF
jgi:hypothetical protein